MRVDTLPATSAASAPRSRAEALVRNVLESADITVGGDRAGDIRIHDRRFYRRVLRDGSVGLGEAYMDGWWDAAHLDAFIAKLLGRGVDRSNRSGWKLRLRRWLTEFQNRQTRLRSRLNARHHYDIGNDLYQAMLDRRMTYTCAYWKNASDLDTAQEHKLDRVCRKLGLEPGMRVLDIGCGWGSFAIYAAETYGVHVTGVTLSRDQMALGTERAKGLPVEIRLEDYREGAGRFDRVVSLGMFEHVGYRNYRTYMETARDRLAPDGLFLLQTIAGNVSVRAIDPWIDRYIFPGAMLPSVSQIGEAAEGLFVVEDMENFGPDYDRTLMAWFDNFDRAWDDLKHRYSERFYRMWTYYLLCCAGGFRGRRNQLWQIVLAPEGAPAGMRGNYR